MLTAYSVTDAVLLAPLALLLDLRFGDPRLPWPHPVILVGRCLAALEAPMRRLAKILPLPEKIALRLCGILSVLLLASGSALLVSLAISLPVIGCVLALYFSWAGLAMGCLIETGNLVLENIEEAPLPKARRSLSWLVSRDTSTMDRPLLRKTLADTLSENFTDALTAPFFWLLVAGPAGLWAYKAISTADSMWGYTIPRWKDLGWAAARSDDLMALIPARISILAISFSHTLIAFLPPQKRLLTGKWPGFFVVHSQALGMPSPNSGCPMAAFAWLCSARMAGPSVYFGEMVNKPWLGPPQSMAKAWSRSLLEQLLCSMRLYSLTGMLLLWALFLLF